MPLCFNVLPFVNDSFHHTPCRLRLAKIHKHKRLVKKYLLGKAKYLQKLARKAKCPWESAAHDDQSTAVLPGTVDVSSDESEVPGSPSCIDTSQVPESPVRITPIKPMKHLVLSPNTCTKIADNKAAALARRAALETAAPTCVQTGLCVTCDQPCGDTMCAQCQMDVLAMPSPKRADAPKSPVPIDKMRRKNPPSKKRDDAQVIKRLTKAPKIFDV